MHLKPSLKQELFLRSFMNKALGPYINGARSWIQTVRESDPISQKYTENIYLQII